MTGIHHYSIVQTISNAIKILCVLPIILPLMHPVATPDVLTVSIILPFAECHIVGIIQYTAFSNCFLSLSSMHLSLLQAFPWLASSLLFSWIVFCSLHLPQFIYSSTEGYTDCFQVLVIMNKTPKYPCVGFVWSQFSAFGGQYQTVWLLDCMVRLCVIL